MKKYPSIEGVWRSKEIQSWLSYYPNLVNEWFILQEKIHGANIQITSEEGIIVIYSRRQKINRGELFQGIDIYSLVENYYQDLLPKKEPFWLYGELCGQGIQKGVDYGEGKKIIFFDLCFEDGWLPPKDFYELMSNTVPSVMCVHGLENAINQRIDYFSRLNPKEGNIMEGVVIKPYYKVYESNQGSLFYLKKKNEAFQEKQKEPKTKVQDSRLTQLNTRFRSYITESRLQSVFSKYGEIEEPNQIGTYIKYVLEDAKEDFLKDNGLELTKKEAKEVFNVGGIIANMLKEYL